MKNKIKEIFQNCKILTENSKNEIKLQFIVKCEYSPSYNWGNTVNLENLNKLSELTGSSRIELIGTECEYDFDNKNFIHSFNITYELKN